MVYSLQDIIKERRFLNNPERIWEENDYQYFIMYDKYVLKFKKKQALTWPSIKKYYKNSGMDPKIDLTSYPNPKSYVIAKEMNAKIQQLIFDYGLATTD